MIYNAAKIFHGLVSLRLCPTVSKRLNNRVCPEIVLVCLMLPAILVETDPKGPAIKHTLNISSRINVCKRVCILAQMSWSSPGGRLPLVAAACQRVADVHVGVIC